MEKIVKNMEVADFFEWRWKDVVVNTENVALPILNYERKIYDSGGATFCSFEPDGSLTSDYSMGRICCALRKLFYKDNKLFAHVEFISNELGKQALEGLEKGTHRWTVLYKKKRAPLRINDVDYDEISSIYGLSIEKKL